MARVTVVFGPGNSVERNYGSTSELLNDAGLAQFLGYNASNVETTQHGTAYNGPLYDGDTITIQTKANKKNG